MRVNRRRLLQSVAAGLGTAGSGRSAAGEPADGPPPDLAAVRSIATAHGLHLTDDRLQRMQTVLPHRQANLQAVREFPIEDAVAPACNGFDS